MRRAGGEGKHGSGYEDWDVLKGVEGLTKTASGRYLKVQAD